MASSNSKPYCSPEHPPPWTNTRSMSLGLPSPRIRSPTLRAAASVNLSAGASESVAVAVMVSISDNESKRRRRAGQSEAVTPPESGRGPGRRGRRRRFRLEAHQFTDDLGAERHFNDAVVDVAFHPRGRTEHHAFDGVDVTMDAAIQHHVRHLHRALDGATFAHRQRRVARLIRTYRTDDATIEMQATLELDIAMHSGGLSDQRIDARLAWVAGEHCPGSDWVGDIVYGDASTVHRKVCDSGATSWRLDCTSTTSCSGLKASGTETSWSKFCR